MNKTLRRILIVTGATLGTVAVLAVVLPFVVPLDAYRGRIETAAGGATGRSFKIEGPLRLTFFPRFGVKAQEVTLANVPGGRAAMMVAVGDIDLSVQVLPLLSGRIALNKIVLDQPTIALEVDKGGNPNWKFGRATTDKTGQTKKGTLTLPAGTEFSGIEISDGKVTYDNAKTGTHRALEHVNIAVAMTTVEQPIAATGEVILADKKLTFAAKLATLKTFLGSGTTRFELSADAELMHAAIKGVLLPDGTTQGAISLSSPSFRGLAGWLGTPLPAGGLGALSLSSKLETKDKITELSDLTVTLDGQAMKGHLTVDAQAKVPHFRGGLDIDHLDLNPYLSGGKAGGSAEPKEAGWSKKPISLSLLKEFNGELALTTGSLQARGLHLGRTALRLVDVNGLLMVWLDQVNLYGGSGKAWLWVDARGKTPQFANTLDFKGVELKPLLKDALNLDTIEGTAALSLDIKMAGASPDAILHSLSGKGVIAGTNGRFRGIDLGAVARTVRLATGGDATNDDAATTFHDIGANFALAQGVLTTSDFHLASPVVQLTGAGAIDIGNRTIDFHIKPSAGVAEFKIGVPFLVKGSWDKLSFTADTAAIVGGVMDGLKNGGAALKNLFGIH